MFINKVVCNKCGTEASTDDKYCRECGEAGRSKFHDDNKKPSITDWQDMVDKLKKPAVETRRCKTCGQIVSNYGHDCPGLFGYQTLSIRYQSEL